MKPKNITLIHLSCIYFVDFPLADENDFVN